MTRTIPTLTCRKIILIFFLKRRFPTKTLFLEISLIPQFVCKFPWRNVHEFVATTQPLVHQNVCQYPMRNAIHQDSDSIKRLFMTKSLENLDSLDISSEKNI